MYYTGKNVTLNLKVIVSLDTLQLDKLGASSISGLAIEMTRFGAVLDCIIS